MIRSHLYVPADATDKLDKALARGADALILDLEDGVAPAAKDAARANAVRWLERLGPTGVEVWVRVNTGALREADVRAVAPLPGLCGIWVAKAETVDEMAQLDRLLTSLGSTAALGALVESAVGVLAAAWLARAPRVRRLQLGEADLQADLGVTLGESGEELLWARSQLVLAAAAARIEPPVGAVSPDFRDLERLRESTRRMARLGFRGRACIHPAQIPVVNDVFTPAEADLARARELVRRFDAGGGGASLDGDGRMIDDAVVRSARRLLGMT